MAVSAAGPEWSVFIQRVGAGQKTMMSKRFPGLVWPVRRCLQGFKDETGEPENISRAGLLFVLPFSLAPALPVGVSGD